VAADWDAATEDATLLWLPLCDAGRGSADDDDDSSAATCQ